MLYLYAIAEGLASIDDLRGTSGEGLSIRVCEGFQVVAGEIDAVPPVDEPSLTLQDNVVRGVHARAAAVLPMRFGAAFRSDADMQRAVALQASSLREKLHLVAGKDQMTMRALRTPDAPAVACELRDQSEGAKPGAAYLRHRAEQQRPKGLEPLLSALDPLQHAMRIERGRTAGVIATVYHLIEKGTSDAYREEAARAAKHLPHVSIHVSGPSPCYAFT